MTPFFTEEAMNKLNPISGSSKSQKGTDKVLKVHQTFPIKALFHGDGVDLIGA